MESGSHSHTMGPASVDIWEARIPSGLAGDAVGVTVTSEIDEASVVLTAAEVGEGVRVVEVLPFSVAMTLQDTATSATHARTATVVPLLNGCLLA